MYTLNGREVKITHSEFNFGECCYVVEAHFVDDGTDLDMDQCDVVTEENQAALYDAAHEKMLSDAYDNAKDIRKYGV